MQLKRGLSAAIALSVVISSLLLAVACGLNPGFTIDSLLLRWGLQDTWVGALFAPPARYLERPMDGRPVRAERVQKRLSPPLPVESRK